MCVQVCCMTSIRKWSIRLNNRVCFLSEEKTFSNLFPFLWRSNNSPDTEWEWFWHMTQRENSRENLSLNTIRVRMRHFLYTGLARQASLAEMPKVMITCTCTAVPRRLAALRRQGRLRDSLRARMRASELVVCMYAFCVPDGRQYSTGK